MRSLILLSTLLLAGCGGGWNRLDPPLIDMSGVDRAKYDQDLAYCTKLKAESTFVGNAQLISRCMTERGYRVTSART
jgi:hypothetical protein